ncbi:hypothetical protein BDW72DRAFT_178136 [Aspergillus terricola var. indicus]
MQESGCPGVGGSAAIIRRVINPDSWELKESTEANKEGKPVVKSASRVPNRTGRQRQAKPQHLLSHHPRPAYTYIHHFELPSLSFNTFASSARPGWSSVRQSPVSLILDSVNTPTSLAVLSRFRLSLPNLASHRTFHYRAWATSAAAIEKSRRPIGLWLA